MHCEPAVTQTAAIDYCKKEGIFEERGTKKLTSEDGGQMNKERFAQAYAAAKTGAFDEIPEDILIRYYRTLKEIRKDNMTKPNSLDRLQNLWIYGEAGTGKTRLADAIAPTSYSKNCNK